MPEPGEPDPIIQLDHRSRRSPGQLHSSLRASRCCSSTWAPTAAHLLRPIHADTLRIGWPPDRRPGELVLEAVERYELTPLLVHSTSWRHGKGRLILTYIAAVARPTDLTHYLADEPVARADLARGDALGPPADIGVAQVVEHAFRHLAWLVQDDAVVGEALGDWVGFLEGYVPEPFRAYGPSA